MRAEAERRERVGTRFSRREAPQCAAAAIGLFLLACSWRVPPTADVATAAVERTPPATEREETEMGALRDITLNEYGSFIDAPQAPAIGDQAPRFRLTTSWGETFDLDDALAGGNAVMLIFYREHL